MSATARSLHVTSPSDAELARSVAGGNAEAFRHIVRRYNDKLFRTARSILEEDAEAEEVLRDAYLLAYRSIGAFQGDSTLGTWLARIVTNEAFRRYAGGHGAQQRRAASTELTSSGSPKALAQQRPSDVEIKKHKPIVIDLDRAMRPLVRIFFRA
jgi:RNA polymerase sigma factor (sigma-70 family)